jgi:hypothetical protein
MIDGEIGAPPVKQRAAFIIGQIKRQHFARTKK